MSADLICKCGSLLSDHRCPNEPLNVGSELREFIKQQERAYVTAAIAKFSGDRVKAADALGISLATIYRKVPGHD